MKLSTAFPSNYLKSDNLQDRDVLVVIATATMEKVGDDLKLVLSFQGKEKTMICNKTNANRIAYLYGEETDDWTGKEIILTSEFVEFQGKTVKGLRIKPPQKRAQVVQKREGYEVSTGKAPNGNGAPRDPAKLDDEIPF